LAILVPTYRFDGLARQALASAAALASDEIAVFIADNSENKQKHEFLGRLESLHANVHTFCHDRNIGALDNWRFLLAASSLMYCLFVSDDDLFTASFVESGLHQLESDSDASAAAGTLLMTMSGNRIMVANRMRLESSAYERCVNFRIGGGNSLPNSMARRRALDPFVRYQENHPLKASFFDWLMGYTLLAQGTYRTEDVGYYIYDASNWEDAEQCWKSNAKFYVAAGLPEGFTWFHELYWAVEFVHFFLGQYSPVADPRQRVDCAQHFYGDRMNVFRQLWNHPSAQASLGNFFSKNPGARSSVAAIVANDDALNPQVFKWFADLLAAFDGLIARAYGDFVTSSLETATRR